MNEKCVPAQDVYGQAIDGISCLPETGTFDLRLLALLAGAMLIVGLFGRRHT